MASTGQKPMSAFTLAPQVCHDKVGIISADADLESVLN
jgi:hypothetical protein